MDEEIKNQEEQQNEQPEEEQKSTTPTNTAKIEQKKEVVVDLKTIMPTMIDDDEDDKLEKKQDISSIVPQSVKLTQADDSVKLRSQSELLKSDGSIVLGTVQGEGIAMQENVTLPEQIDIEQRKKEAKELREGKKKKKKERDVNKAKQEMRTLNKKTLITLALIALVVGLAYYVKKNPGIREFQPLTLTIELGDKLPLHSAEYVQPGSGQTVDDLTFVVDTSNVDPEKVGQYQYTVKHNNVVKIGMIIIQDTTPPELDAKNLIITEGVSYNATDFVKDCYDISGSCDFSFEEEGTETKYTAPGDYTIYVAATDMYSNKTIKQVSLTIEERGKVKYFIKEDPYDPSLGYQLTTKYELHFTDLLDTAVILNGIKIMEYQYDSEESFKKGSYEKKGTEGTTVKDAEMLIIEETKANKIGDNERYEYVIEFLLKNGFRETNSDYE